MSASAKDCEGCNGCQWAGLPSRDGDWCYMFATAPEKLPCAQHDKFEFEQAIMAIMIRKNPALLTALCLSVMDE